VSPWYGYATVVRIHRDHPIALRLHREKRWPPSKTNSHRMRYAHFREDGMFLGSGTVEAGFKTFIGQRLKLSGMR